MSGEVGNIAGLSGLAEGCVLEPMCGSGRLLRGFKEEGFETVGVDSSAEMLALARAHYEKHGYTGAWIQADVRDFDLDQACDLAVCPINSLAHLQSEADMLAHLNAMSRNLYEGASYWIQLDLKAPAQVGASEEWEFEYLGETLISQWACTGYHDGTETHVSRFVFPDGRVIEDDYALKVWNYARWSALLERSPFELSAAYAGGSFDPLAIGSNLHGERVFWQQLVKLH
ncbi:MAG: class I SAM-dependent methyltransferase [Gammaproteobacteria bacterium]|nr:MAG: class I SAM-dependent methyltransferase [Gammaproteobacteria bacterium]